MRYQKLILLLLFFPLILKAQNGAWQENRQLFVPSGVEIDSLHIDFQILDWDGDTWPDIMINENGRLRYFQCINPREFIYQQRDLVLPLLPPQSSPEYWLMESNNFCAADLDNDGDWDLVADSLLFYRNTGSNAHPVWRQDSIFFANRIDSVDLNYTRGIVNDDFTFFDYEGDGDLDLLARHRDIHGNSEGNTYLFLYDPQRQRWIFKYRFGSLFFHGSGNIHLVDLVGDSDPDLFRSGKGFGGMSMNDIIRFELYPNLGTPNQPVYGNQPALSGRFERPHSRYTVSDQFYDIDGDGDLDYIWFNPNRQLDIRFNETVSGQVFAFKDKNVRLGRLCVTANAQPALFKETDRPYPSLIVSENYDDWYWASDMFMHIYGRLLDLGAWGAFRQDFKTYPNFRALNWKAFNIQSDQMQTANYDLCVTFPEDPPGSIALSFRHYYNWELKGYKVQLFRHRSAGDSTFWEMDSTLASFSLSPRLYNRPLLADGDLDGQPELYIRENTLYTCFKNQGSSAAPDWQPAPESLEGIAERSHFHLAMADLDSDGDPDMIFGDADGTLHYYRNQRPEQPQWQYMPEVFAGLDVGEDAAPAIGDIDQDGDLDLIVGNRIGQLFGYQLPEYLQVEREAAKLPAGFRLLPAFPNPFNDATTITIETGKRERLEVAIYNSLGRLVTRLFEGKLPSGRHRWRWEGREDSGQPAPSGLYILSVRSQSDVQHLKCLLLR